MESQKIYLGNGGTGSDSLGASAGLTAMLTSALQSRGLDMNAVLPYIGGNGGRNGGGLFGGDGSIGDLIALVIIAGIFGWGGNGGPFGGNRGGGPQDGGSAERELLMNAIQRNGTDLAALGNTIGCNAAQMSNAVSAVANSLASLSGQLGLSVQQVINRVQSGDASLATQLAQGLSDNRLDLCQRSGAIQQGINSVATGQERGFSEVNYNMRSQTCDLQDSIRSGIDRVVAGQQAAEMRELQRDIAERDRRISEQAVVINNGQQSALFGQMIGNALAPVNAALTGLQKGLSEVECRLPQTYPVPWQPFTAIPNAVAAQLGLAGYGIGTAGYWG